MREAGMLDDDDDDSDSDEDDDESGKKKKKKKADAKKSKKDEVSLILSSMCFINLPSGDYPHHNPPFSVEEWGIV